MFRKGKKNQKSLDFNDEAEAPTPSENNDNKLSKGLEERTEEASSRNLKASSSTIPTKTKEKTLVSFSHVRAPCRIESINIEFMLISRRMSHMFLPLKLGSRRLRNEVR